jgi:hypothetical protein
MTSVSRKTSAACGAFVLGTLTGAIPAAELSYGVDVGAGYSDNVTRVGENEVDDTIATLGGQLRLDHESARLKANIATRLEYRDYLDDTFDGDLVGNFIGASRFDLVEDRIAWTVDDTFGQTSRNQFSADTPDNRESVNFLSTGPDLTLPFGSRNSLELHGRYSNVNYEVSDLGNDRVRGELAVLRKLSAASVVSLHASTEQVSFDEPDLYADFDRNEAYLAYEVEAARTQMSIQGGTTEVRSSGQTDDGWLGRFKLSRHTSSALTVGFELGHEFSDAGNSFVQQQAQQPGSTDPVSAQQTSAPFQNEFLSVFTDFARNRTSFGLRAGYYEETYESLPLFDRERSVLQANVRRSLSATLTARAGVNYSKFEYSEAARKFSELDATLGVVWRLGRNTSLSVDYIHLDRSGDEGAVEYGANELWVRIGYLVGEGAGFGSSSGM